MKNVKFIIQVISNSLKQKMAAKTCIQQKYAIYDYTKKMCPHVHQRKCNFGDKFTISTKCSYSHDYESKSSPDGRVS